GGKLLPVRGCRKPGGAERENGRAACRVARSLGRFGFCHCNSDFHMVAVPPPSTCSVTPVVKLARGEARNNTACATSCGRPSRPSGGLRLASAFLRSEFFCAIA